MPQLLSAYLSRLTLHFAPMFHHPLFYNLLTSLLSFHCIILSLIFSCSSISFSLSQGPSMYNFVPLIPSLTQTDQETAKKICKFFKLEFVQSNYDVNQMCSFNHDSWIMKIMEIIWNWLMRYACLCHVIYHVMYHVMYYSLKHSEKDLLSLMSDGLRKLMNKQLRHIQKFRYL